MEFLIILGHHHSHKYDISLVEQGCTISDQNYNYLVSKKVIELMINTLLCYLAIRYCHFGITTSTWSPRTIEGHKMLKQFVALNKYCQHHRTNKLNMGHWALLSCVTFTSRSSFLSNFRHFTVTISQPIVNVERCGFFSIEERNIL